jgi:hypothetical protein
MPSKWGEKLLQALLVVAGRSYALTHDLVCMIGLVAETGKDMTYYFTYPYVCNKNPLEGALINMLKIQDLAADIRARMRREKAKAAPTPKIGRGPGTSAKLYVALKFSMLPWDTVRLVLNVSLERVGEG